MKFFILLHILLLVVPVLFAKKKSIVDYTEAELERLYEEWEENDEEKLEEDELPEFQRKPKSLDPKDIENAKSPDDLMKMTKKGQTLMMFVGVVDPKRPDEKSIRQFTDNWTSLWQTSLFNNHVDAQVFVVDDNRAIFMFKDGSQAFEAKKFLTEQPQVYEVTLEGQIYKGKGALVMNKKSEL